MSPSARRTASRIRTHSRSALDRWAPAHSAARLGRDSADYWNDPTEAAWRSNSHWRDGIPDAWESVGRDHLQLFERLARVQDQPPRWGRVIEWGAGGGANAVHFAPRADEFVAVDVAHDSLLECARQVAAACDTPITGVHVDVGTPETVLSSVSPGSCDLFLCLYVLELVPTREYAMRLMSLASDLLADGGLAFVQFKYADRKQRRPRRAYARNLAAMTDFDIADFWIDAERAGLRAQVIHLVPQNALDSRYAYALLSRPPR